MGGSSLAPLIFSSAFPPPEGFPQLEVLDSTEPSSVRAEADRSDPEKTLFIVSSKSGTTLEPNLFFDYFFSLSEKALGSRAGERFLIITDPGSPLEREASRRRVRRIFSGDPGIGGRYSALSGFGLVPAAFLGIPLTEFLARAQREAERCRAPLRENPGALLGAAIAALAAEGRDKLTLSVGPSVASFGMWLEQLLAESTGKEGKGVVPVDGEPLSSPSLYGRDRLFVRIEARNREDGETARRLRAVAREGHPTAWLSLEDSLDLAAQMFLWEFAIAVTGALLGINPFDQPNVQEAKDRTSELLGREAGGGRREAGTEQALDEIGLRHLLDSIRPGDYFAILAFLPPTAENEERLNAIRRQVRDAKKVATTLGFGPRYLHSTGQLHKGGPDTGVFLQVTVDPAASVAIPGRPYDFGDVVVAQAEGDLAALRARGRRAFHVHLSEEGNLPALSGAVSRALGTQ